MSVSIRHVGIVVKNLDLYNTFISSLGFEEIYSEIEGGMPIKELFSTEAKISIKKYKD